MSRHVPDIRDDLKGKYPKDFKFTGWHPWCRCYAVPILPSPEEFTSFDMDAAHHADEVTDVPRNFKKWVGKNEERIAKAKKLPNFLKDNGKYWEHIASRGREISEKALLEAYSTQTLAEKYLSNPELLPLAVRKQIPHLDEMLRVKDNADYKDVKFDIYTGSCKASHRQHNFDKDGGKYELLAQNAGYKAGHSVILEKEISDIIGQRFTEGKWDELDFEVAASTTGTTNNVLAKLSHCAAKRTTDVAVIVFPNGDKGFNVDVWNKALKRFKGTEKLNTGQYKKFKRILCVQDEKIIVDMEGI